MRIYLGRHCRSAAQDNYEYRQTHSDRETELHPEGHSQAPQMGEALNRLLDEGGHQAEVTIIRSPYRRVEQTSAAVEKVLADHNKTVKVTVDERLREIDKGEFWTLVPKERLQKWGKLYRHYERKKHTPNGWFKNIMPCGASPEVLDRRVGRFCEDLRRADPEGTDKVIICHDLPVRTLVKNLLGKSVKWLHDQPTPNNGSWRLLEGPDWDHLEDKGYVYEGFSSPAPGKTPSVNGR